MVHTGKPSRGCVVCRKRRIKCDERSPSCSYCIKTKQPCPGYKDAFDLAWRDQTSAAQKSVERRRRAAEHSRGESSTGLSSSPQSEPLFGTDPSETSKITTSIPSSLVETQENYALGFFFSTYANPPSYSDDRCSYLECVAPQFLTTTSDSVLRMATMTIASSLFVAWLNERADNPNSRAFYARAVSKMKGQIHDREACADDEMLTSVLLLQLYEKLMSRTRGTPVTGTHLEGALALIRHRGVENFRDSTSLGLLFQVRSQLIDECFRTSKPLPPDIASWGTSIHQRQISTPLGRLDNINVLLVNLSAHVQSIFSGSHNTELRPPHGLESDPSLLYQIYDAYKLACSIESQLEDWSSFLDTSWQPIRVTGTDSIHPSIAEAGLYQPHCYVYTNTSKAYTRNKQLMTSFKVSCIQHRLLSWQSKSQTSGNSVANLLLDGADRIATEQRLILTSLADVETKIQQLADELLANIPFLLGSKTQPEVISDTRMKYPHLPDKEVPLTHYRMAAALGGFWLLGPLKELLELRLDGEWDLRKGQKMWVGSQMRRIANIYNLGK